MTRDELIASLTAMDFDVNNQLHRVGVVLVIMLAAWLVMIGRGLATWLRAWRDAASSPGCAGCALTQVDVVAYPADASPLTYCRRCAELREHFGDEGELPLMVGLRRPVDPVHLIEAALITFVTIALTAAYVVAVLRS